MVKNQKPSLFWLFSLFGLIFIVIGGALGGLASALIVCLMWFIWDNKSTSYFKKVFLSFLVLILGLVFYVLMVSLLFGAVNYFQVSDTENITIHNSKYGFELVHPSNWFEKPADYENTVLYLYTVDTGLVPAITIRSHLNEGMTQEESNMLFSMPQYLAELENEPTVSEVYSANVSINGIPFKGVIYIEEFGGKKVKIFSTMIVLNSSEKLGVNYIADELVFDHNFGEAVRIIGSIKFN